MERRYDLIFCLIVLVLSATAVAAVYKRPDSQSAEWEHLASQLWRYKVDGGYVYAYGANGVCFVPDSKPASVTPENQ